MHSDLEIYFVACDHTKPPRLQLFRAFAAQSVSISLRSSDAFWFLYLLFVFTLVFMQYSYCHDIHGAWHDGIWPHRVIHEWYMTLTHQWLWFCCPDARFSPSARLVPHAPAKREATVCVCEPSEEMYIKLLSFAGGPWALGWHGPTKTHPSCCANVPAIFESWRGVANPRTTMVTMPFLNDNHIRIFEFSTWTDEGDFSFICLHSWRNLRLRWISCPLQFSAYIAAFFLASIDFIPVFKVATKESSLHSTPNTLLFLSGVTGLFLHVRCAPQQNSQWQFWASVWLMLDLSRWHEPFGEYLSR